MAVQTRGGQPPAERRRGSARLRGHTRRRAARRSAGRRSLHARGRLIAGWPEMLNGGVNGTNSPARRCGAPGSSLSLTITPSSIGGSASVGVSRRSHPSSHHPCTARRNSIWAFIACSSCGAENCDAYSAIAQFIGSMSSGVSLDVRSPPRERPATRPSCRTTVLRTAGRSPGRRALPGSRARTSWPSFSSIVRRRRGPRRRTRRAASHQRADGGRAGRSRSRPGSAPISSRYGRSGGGAVSVSPTPDRAWRRAAQRCRGPCG